MQHPHLEVEAGRARSVVTPAGRRARALGGRRGVARFPLSGGSPVAGWLVRPVIDHVT